MRKGRVLIVDDQEEILESLEAALGDEGYEVIRAKDGQEALHVAQSESLDLVFLDVWIPGIDGMQTLRAIKRIDPDCPVVMMSGHGTIETAVKAIKLGATDYLEKPLNLEDILKIVEQTTETGSREMTQERSGPSPNLLIGNSELSARLRAELEEAAQSGSNIWLWGAKGAGKEFAARIAHSLSRRSGHALVKVRLNELSETNLKDTLLGKPNGNNANRRGKISQAKGGALLFTGIDRLENSTLQRFAEAIQPFAASATNSRDPYPSHTMIMISSNRSPRELIDSSPPAAAEILEALAHKVIRIPELQERIEDLPLFVDHFLREAAKEFDRNIVSADPGAVERMKRYRWPGNVKELKILMEHVVMTAAGPTITVADLMIPELDGALSREPTAEHDGPVTPIDGDLNTPSGSSNEVETLSASNKGPVRVVTRWDIPQKTLNGRVVMYGQGLHSGAKTGLIISPLPAGSGIVFGHINSEGTVAARLENVISTEMATSLRGQDCAAGTIEHLMAVFNVYGLNNLLVKISGEVPIMDGSAVEFLNLVENAQIMSQGEPTQEITLRAPIELPLPEGSRKRMILEPSDKFQVHYFMDYPKPIGKLSLEFVCDDPVSFKNEIAPARTFGFVKDVKMMDEMGLAGGGRLSNLILVDDEKVVNPPLRFPDEFVRHKILDIIGDFYLLGRPIRAKVIAHQTGHSENIEMLKLIWENMRG